MKTKIILFTGLLFALVLNNAIVANQFPMDELVSDSVLMEDIEESDEIYPIETQQEKEVTKKGDTTFISIGSKKIQIIEGDGQTDVKIKDKNQEDEDDDKYTDLFDDSDEDLDPDRPGKNFKGHWSGFEFGLCNYMNSSNNFKRSPEDEFMDITTSRSWNINLNFAQHSLGFGTDRVGILTGMGFEWSNYHFANDNTIEVNSAGIIDSVGVSSSTTKNRLQTTYVTFPLLLEFQSGARDPDDRAYFGFGVIGGVRLFSNTKLKSDDKDSKQKIKGNYNLRPLRYAFTARIGFKSLKLYANYYPVSLFMDDKGPELYPIAGGLVLSF